jgi:hypothetical protein
VQKGLDLISHLERNSVHEKPLLTIATKVGKVHLTNSTDLEYSEKNNQRYVTLKTPYKKDEFLKITNRDNLPEGAFEREGIIYTSYLDGQ